MAKGEKERMENNTILERERESGKLHNWSESIEFFLFFCVCGESGVKSKKDTLDIRSRRNKLALMVIQCV